MTNIKSILVVAQVYSKTGGSYRAKKAIEGYIKSGKTVQLFVPYGEKYRSSLKDSDNLPVQPSGYSSIPKYLERIPFGYYLPLKAKFLVRLRILNREISPDVVVSQHEIPDAILTARKASEEFNIPSISILQLPPIYKSKKRLQNIREAYSLHFSLLFPRDIRKRIFATLYPLLQKMEQKALKKELRKFDGIIGVSKAIEIETGLKMKTLDPGVTLDREDLELMNQIKSQYHQKKNHIVFGGRPVPLKGVVEAILSFKEIVKMEQNLKLIITGGIDDKTKDAIYKFAKNLKLNKNIVITGYVPQRKRMEIVRTAKLMLYPTHADSVSYAVLEALYLGTPVVSYDIPAIRYYYKSNPGVVLVPELDIEGLSEEAINVLKDPPKEIVPPNLPSWNDIIREELRLIEGILT